MTQATLTSKGQITVPVGIRNFLHVSGGDRVDFVIDERGKVTLEPVVLDIDDIFGIAKQKKVVSVEEMNQAIEERMLRKYKSHVRH